MPRKRANAKILSTGWEIRPRDGSLPIRGELRVKEGQRPRNAVVICHGFKGFRRWGFFPALARAIARHDHVAITFDFTRNGVGDDGVDFSALDRFAENTHSRNLDEIRRVMDAVVAGELLGYSPRMIALLGHSRGGGEAILAAGRDPRVSALVTWSAISGVHDRWGEGYVNAWRAGETVFIANSRTRQQMPIAPTFWSDIDRNREQLDVLAHAAKLRIPWLIIHGDQDETVPVADAHALFAASDGRADLRIIPGGSHTFGATHPYAGPAPHLKAASAITLEWLDHHLR